VQFAGSLRYFGLGEIELRQNFDDIPQIVKPNEQLTVRDSEIERKDFLWL
jgi:hypothetical protein